MQWRRFVGLGVGWVLLATSALAERAPAKDSSPPQVLSARDTLRINRVGAPTLSPDGNWVLYTQRTRDLKDEEMKALTHIWRVRVDGSERRQMTFGSESCSSPAWFSDGRRMAFLSSRVQKQGKGKGGRGMSLV
ncbi:MAG: TolB family protein [Acidobacteriota bacterium]